MSKLAMLIETEYPLFEDNDSEEGYLKELLLNLEQGMSYSILSDEERKLLRAHGYDHLFAIDHGWQI